MNMLPGRLNGVSSHCAELRDGRLTFGDTTVVDVRRLKSSELGRTWFEGYFPVPKHLCTSSGSLTMRILPNETLRFDDTKELAFWSEVPFSLQSFAVFISCTDPSSSRVVRFQWNDHDELMKEYQTRSSMKMPVLKEAPSTNVHPPWPHATFLETRF